MKTFFTFAKKLMLFVALIAVSVNADAAKKSFATIADMLKGKVVKNDVVTITNGVVIEYIVGYDAVIKDKDGDSSCLINSYYLNKLQEERKRLVTEKPELIKDYAPLKSGDILNNFVGIVSFSTNNKIITFDPDIDLDALEFKKPITITPATEPYTVKTKVATVNDLLTKPNEFDGKVVSIENCKSFNKGFNGYLLQGTDTLKKFNIYGLNSEDYPKEFNIDYALFLDGRLSLNKSDYSVSSFKNFESIKATYKGNTAEQNINIDINMQVLKKEEIDGKTYIIAKTGKGKALYQHSAVRICLEQLNDVDKEIKNGNIINIVSKNVKFIINNPNAEGGFTPSFMSVAEHTTKMIDNTAKVSFGEISPDEIHALYDKYEFLPVILNGKIKFTDNADETQKAHNVSTADFVTGLDENEKPTKILVDVSLMPKSEEEEWMICGILDFPLWMGASRMAVLTPLAANNFISTYSEFANIKDLIDNHAPIMSDATYKINSNMTIIGNCTVKALNKRDNDKNVVFIHDGTSALELDPLRNWSLDYKVGDCITGVYGHYRQATPSVEANDGSIIFGSADRLLLDSLHFVPATSDYKIRSKQVTIADLLESDKYASELVMLKNVKYKKIVVESFAEQEVEILERHFIYQGTDSIAVSPEFKYDETMSTIRGIFYLNDTYTQVLPRTQEDINCPEEPEDVAVDVTKYEDANVYVNDGIIYADNAYIKVYDLTGKLFTEGVNSVSVQTMPNMVCIVKTIYDNGDVFVSKIANH